jgi:hypothetical protein
MELILSITLAFFIIAFLAIIYMFIEWACGVSDNARQKLEENNAIYKKEAQKIKENNPIYNEEARGMEESGLGMFL